MSHLDFETVAFVDEYHMKTQLADQDLDDEDIRAELELAQKKAKKRERNSRPNALARTEVFLPFDAHETHMTHVAVSNNVIVMISTDLTMHVLDQSGKVATTSVAIAQVLAASPVGSGGKSAKKAAKRRAKGGAGTSSPTNGIDNVAKLFVDPLGRHVLVSFEQSPVLLYVLLKPGPATGRPPFSKVIDLVEAAGDRGVSVGDECAPVTVWSVAFNSGNHYDATTGTILLGSRTGGQIWLARFESSGANGVKKVYSIPDEKHPIVGLTVQRHREANHDRQRSVVATTPYRMYVFTGYGTLDSIMAQYSVERIGPPSQSLVQSMFGGGRARFGHSASDAGSARGGASPFKGSPTSAAILKPAAADAGAGMHGGQTTTGADEVRQPVVIELAAAPGQTSTLIGADQSLTSPISGVKSGRSPGQPLVTTTAAGSTLYPNVSTCCGMSALRYPFDSFPDSFVTLHAGGMSMGRLVDVTLPNRCEAAEQGEPIAFAHSHVTCEEIDSGLTRYVQQQLQQNPDGSGSFAAQTAASPVSSRRGFGSPQAADSFSQSQQAIPAGGSNKVLSMTASPYFIFVTTEDAIYVMMHPACIPWRPTKFASNQRDPIGGGGSSLLGLNTAASPSSLRHAGSFAGLGTQPSMASYQRMGGGPPSNNNSFDASALQESPTDPPRNLYGARGAGAVTVAASSESGMPAGPEMEAGLSLTHHYMNVTHVTKNDLANRIITRIP
jgi:hypothetical protein